MRSVLVNSLFNSGKQVVAILVAFIATPIFVHSLGNERYGLWSLIVSITGYYSFLEFGVATAVVKYVSEYVAQGDRERTASVYSTASLFFGGVGVLAFTATLVIGFSLDAWFDLPLDDGRVVFSVVLLLGANMALSLAFSVLNASLFAVQEIPALATIETVTNVVRNLLLVVLLLQGYGLMMMAVVTVSLTLPRLLVLRLVLRARHPTLRFRLEACRKSTLGQILTYSVYSFLIAIAANLLYYTSSVIIGKMIGIAEVTFYSIAASILFYFEAVVWAMLQVLIPVISSHDAVGDRSRNRQLYTLGTRYSIALILPVMVTLFTIGDVFIANWMGPEYGTRCRLLLQILVVGYSFQFAQFTAHAILKGVNRHRVLAFLLLGQAAAGILLSIGLVRDHGIEGVGIGIAIPLVAANLLFIPLYTCRVLKMEYSRFLRRTLAVPVGGVAAFALLHRLLRPQVQTYFDVALYAAAATVFFAVVSWFLLIEVAHKQLLVAKLRALVPWRHNDG